MDYLSKIAISTFRTAIYATIYFLLTVIFYYYHFIVAFAISMAMIFVSVFAEFVYMLFVVDKKHKEMLNGIDSYFDETDDLMESGIDKKTINKIYSYRKYKKLMNIFNPIMAVLCGLDFVIVILIAYKDFFSNQENIPVFVMLIIFVLGVVALFIYLSIKDNKKLNTIELDIKHKEFETVEGKPVEIIPLYCYGGDHGVRYGGVYVGPTKITNRNRYSGHSMGYGIRMVFSNDVKVLALFEFPGMGYGKTKRSIYEELLRKKYNFKYLKNSKIVISGIGKVKDAFK